ncbi:hypothetical protein F4604DRAFT_1679367 [Suillus subluteus]|nr:hypothetical protein F4604DRAFT_1679367 [Suillus subluteus]
MTISLKKLGLRVQLENPAGAKCLFPKRAFNDDFTLIDTNGIHEIGLDFCGCETAQTHMKQLLHMAWFPATTTDPCTAATFQILEQYHILSFESKCSSYELYHTIMQLLDNTGLYPRKYQDHYKAFMQMVRKWRHLKILKQAGWGYDSAGVESTGSSKCAVLCPACPQPVNSWLYALFVAIDANFRLKRCIVSKDSMDPSLSRGWAYFVEETAYKTYLQTCSGNTQQKSTCSSHNTVNMADSKVSHGLATTGVGTIDCAQHNMKLPNGVGDLQKGERYSNMDFCSSQHFVDIALTHSMFHMTSLNVGQTDGEAPECGWSNINPMASSTKEMGPGSWRDVLDDHFGDWNWKKVVGLGATLLCKMTEANKEQEAHQTAFQELHKVLAPKTTEAWTVKVESWEENPNDSLVTNPFKSKVIAQTHSAQGI